MMKKHRRVFSKITGSSIHDIITDKSKYIMNGKHNCKTERHFIFHINYHLSSYCESSIRVLYMRKLAVICQSEFRQIMLGFP